MNGKTCTCLCSFVLLPDGARCIVRTRIGTEDTLVDNHLIVHRSRLFVFDDDILRWHDAGDERSVRMQASTRELYDDLHLRRWCALDNHRPLLGWFVGQPFLVDDLTRLRWCGWKSFDNDLSRRCWRRWQYLLDYLRPLLQWWCWRALTCTEIDAEGKSRERTEALTNDERWWRRRRWWPLTNDHWWRWWRSRCLTFLEQDDKT